MQIVNGLVYAAFFAAGVHFLLTMNAIGNASSPTTRRLVKLALALLVVIPMVLGFSKGLFGIDSSSGTGLAFRYGGMISSAVGLFLLTRSIQHAVVEAYARTPPGTQEHNKAKQEGTP